MCILCVVYKVSGKAYHETDSQIRVWGKEADIGTGLYVQTELDFLLTFPKQSEIKQVDKACRRHGQ
jgi:hypothetical protein